MGAAFGPHEADVLRVLSVAGHLPPERLPELLAFALDDESGAADTGRRQVARLRRDPELGPRLQRAEDATLQWASELRYDHLLPTGGYEMGSGVDPRARSVAARVLFDALAALIARDELAREEFDALLRPWRLLTGPLTTPKAAPDR